MTISQIPDWVISSHLLPCLNVRELSRVACVSNRFNRLSSKDSLWQKLWTLFPTHPFPNPSNRDWKAHFTFTHTVNFRMFEAQEKAKINQYDYHAYAKFVVPAIGLVKVIYELGRSIFYLYSLKRFPCDNVAPPDSSGLNFKDIAYKHYVKSLCHYFFYKNRHFYVDSVGHEALGYVLMSQELISQYRHHPLQEPTRLTFKRVGISLGYPSLMKIIGSVPLDPETIKMFYSLGIWFLIARFVPQQFLDNSFGFIIGKTHAAAIWTFDKLNKLTNSFRRSMHGGNLTLMTEKIFTAWSTASQAQANNNISAIHTFVCSSPSLFLIGHLGGQNHHYDRLGMENRTIKKTNIIGGIALIALGALSEMAGDKTVAGLSMSSGVWFVIKGIVPQRTFNNFYSSVVKKTQTVAINTFKTTTRFCSTVVAKTPAVARWTFNKLESCVNIEESCVNIVRSGIRRFTRLFW